MQQEAAAGPDLKRRRWRWSLYFGGWTFVALLFVGPIIAQSLAEGVEIPWSSALSEVFGWYIWGLLFPLIWWLVRRYPIERKRLLQRLPINLAFGILIVLVYVVLTLIKKDVIEAAQTGSWTFDKLREMDEFVFGGIEYYLAMYLGIVAVIHALSYYEKYRERELKSTRLEAQLALANLEVLKMQLNPHFLFNSLNAISALMHRDVDAADRMITLLSDLLRLSLDKDDRHQVSLSAELEFLNRYLEIEKIRFRDRLRVEVDVGSQCLAAQVPRLILQPLVENSIKHGIAMRSAAGRVAIRARRKDGRLDLEIWDDGPGVPRGGADLQEGVGLANTRARLEQIYGDDHRFELKNAEVGGLSVRLQIPFEEQARIRVAGVA